MVESDDRVLALKRDGGTGVRTWIFTLNARLLQLKLVPGVRVWFWLQFVNQT